MKQIFTALRLFLFMTLLTGIIYPVLITLVANSFFSQKAQGSFIISSEKILGSELIAQKFNSDKYFWSRPSAVDFNPLPSGGSNLSQTSQSLKMIVDERRALLKLAHPNEMIEPPQDLLFASASGLDPHISPAAAEYQISRLAKARGRLPNEIKQLVVLATETPQFGLLGEPRINVLKLNLLLDN